MRMDSRPAATVCPDQNIRPTTSHTMSSSFAWRRTTGRAALCWNHHLDGQVWLNNTAYRNATDYNMLCSTNNASSAGVMRHLQSDEKVILAPQRHLEGNKTISTCALCDVRLQFFHHCSVTVTAGDFISLDESLLTAPRQANGDLPYINFARLTNTSDCINVGTNLYFPFYGSAPDLGAFEFGPTNAPDPTRLPSWERI